MENMITLFKAPWTQGSLNQPYFASNTARNQYLQTLPNVTLNLNKPNIKFDYGLNITIVIPLDYTNSTDYNFCQLIYNDKLYYATIEDYSLVSVGFTELKLYRHLLSERTNFFQYFRSFQIVKSTNLDYTYDKETGIKKPNFRFSRTIKSVNPKMHFRLYTDSTTDYTEVDRECVPVKCVVIFRTTLDGEMYSGTDNFFGLPSQYTCLIYPVSCENYDGCFYRTIETTNKVMYLVTGFSGNTSKKLIDYIEKNSSYITSVKVVNLMCPLITIGEFTRPCLPFYYAWVTSEDAVIGVKLENTAYEKTDIIESYYFYEHEFYYPYGDVEVRFYSPDISVKVDKSDYSGTVNKIMFKCYYFLGVIEDELLVCTYSESFNSIVGTSEYLFTSLDMGSSIPYIITAESTFNNANQYYDAMTKSVRNQKIIGSVLGGISPTGVGAAEFAFGSQFLSGGGKLSSQSLGTGNIIRGASSLIGGIIDSVFYEEQREITAKNEKHGIDNPKPSGSGYVRLYESQYMWQVIEEIPFEQDWSLFINELGEFGQDCILFKEDISIDDYLINDYFFIKAYVLLKENNENPLNMPEYEFFYTLLTNGCRYHYIAEST